MAQTIHNILVTGGNGKIGRHTVQSLREHGYRVTSADLTPGDWRLAHPMVVDLTDLGQVYGALEGQDAVIHLGAIPAPGQHPPEVVFKNNMLSTFNVLQAACVLGIRRVVLAGSISALGFTFAHRSFKPLYIPIDEQHPLLPQDVYGISKALLEEIGASFARRDPAMAIISLRFTTVLTGEEILRDLEHPRPDLARVFWGYVDVRDAAEACRLAVENAKPGFEAMFIAAPNTLSRRPIRELLDEVYPGITSIAEDFGAFESVLSTQKAREKIGFQAQYTWERLLQEKAARP